MFSGLNHVEIANKLIDTGEGKYVAYNIEKFSGLNAEIANKLFDIGQGMVVAYNLEKFSGLNHVEVANKLIDAGQSQYVVYNLEKFSGLNAEIARKLLSSGLISIENLKQYKDSFSGIDELIH